MEAQTQQPEPLTRRIVATLIAPRSLVPAFRAGTPWVDALIVSTAVAMLAVYFLPEGFFVEQMSDAVNRRGDPVDITSTPAEIARWGRYLGMLTALATYPLFAIGLAGLLSLVVRMLGDQGTTFRDHLALASHAFLILALGSLLAIVLQRITGDPDAFFTPALFLPDSESLPVRILAGIDLFTVWMLSVVSIWLGALNPRHGATRFALILLGLYLALNVATALLLR
jgi:hypothetical protein